MFNDFLSQVVCGRAEYCGVPKEGYSLVSPKDESENVKEKEDIGRPDDVSSDIWNAEVAASKAMNILSDQFNNQYFLEKGTVYAAAIAMPQVARSAGWSLRYTELAIRSFFFLTVNVFVQCFLLYMLSSEERVWQKYAGQMHLCDFAYGLGSCPGGTNCRGPGGTDFSPARLYDFPIWQTRTYVRDALALLFPERAAEIYDQVDPGEYGLESYHLRLLCCYLFILGLWKDFKQTMNMLNLILLVPAEDGLWASYEPPFQSPKEMATEPRQSELEFIKFKIAGMPFRWKFINVCFVWLPKMYIWLLMVDIGTVFLMETSDINSMIMNSVALAFILSLDEVICESVMSSVTQFVLENLEPFQVGDEVESSEALTEKEAYGKNDDDKQYSFSGARFWMRMAMAPGQLILVGILTAFFTGKYYLEHCQREEDGSWVSKPIEEPYSAEMPFLSFILAPLPFDIPVKTGPQTWLMPSGQPDFT